jgi:CBS domain-containing protein
MEAGIMETPLSVVLNDKGHSVQNISPQNTIHQCASKMNECGVGALMVIENGQVVGIISERDILKKVVVTGEDVHRIQVAAVMTKELVTVTPATTVQEAMHIVIEKRIRHLPVMEKGKLVGLISIGDLTRSAMLWQEQQITSLKHYIQT